MIDYKIQFLFYYDDKIDVKRTVQIVVVLCWYLVSAFKVTSGYIAHLLLKPRIMEWLLLALCPGICFRNSTRKTLVLPWSLTLLSTSIPSVDRWCLFLSIWLLLVWYENRLHLYFHGREPFSLCVISNLPSVVVVASNQSPTNRPQKVVFVLDVQ